MGKKFRGKHGLMPALALTGLVCVLFFYQNFTNITVSVKPFSGGSKSVRSVASLATGVSCECKPENFECDTPVIDTCGNGCNMLGTRNCPVCPPPSVRNNACAAANSPLPGCKSFNGDPNCSVPKDCGDFGLFSSQSECGTGCARESVGPMACWKRTIQCRDEVLWSCQIASSDAGTRLTNAHREDDTFRGDMNINGFTGGDADTDGSCTVPADIAQRGTITGAYAQALMNDGGLALVDGQTVFSDDSRHCRVQNGRLDLAPRAAGHVYQMSLHCENACANGYCRVTIVYKGQVCN